MITITGQREIAKCNVYRDDVDALTFYAISQSPRVALDDEQKPLFSLVQYRRDVSRLTEEQRRTRLGGGLLTLSVELRLGPTEEKTIRDTLAADPALHRALEASSYRVWWLNEIRRDKAQLAKAIKLGAVPITDGTVGISVLGETPTASGEFVATLVGGGRVSMTGQQRAAVMAKLTLDGAVMLMQMASRRLPAIRVGYDLTFQHRLDAVRMSVWCHAEKAFHSIQDQWASLKDDASWSVKHSGNSTHYTFSHDESNSARNLITKIAHDSEASGVDIIPEAGQDVIPTEQIAELQKIGYDMIKDFLAATFLTWKPGEGDMPNEQPKLETQLAVQDGKEYGHHGVEYYNLKTWTESMSADLAFNLRQKAVVKGFLGPNDNLGNLIGNRRIEDFVTQVDLDADWFKYLDVQVICTADFEQDPVDLVTTTLAYHARGSEGQVDKTHTLAFKKDTTTGRFATFLAGPDLTSYTYEYEVHYKGSAATYRGSGRTDADILVLDTDRLGILRVNTQLGLVDWDQIRQVHVKLSYGAGADRKQTEFTLEKDRQSHVWVEVIGKLVDAEYTCEVSWVDKSNQRLADAPLRSRSPNLVLNQPLGESMEVVVSPAGTFGDLLSQVVVALRYKDEANNYLLDDAYTFTKAEAKVWKVPLRNKMLRQYEYQVTVFYSDGVTREDGWRSTDKAILAVGDPFGYRVQVSPYLLKNPAGQWAFAIVRLRFSDPAENIRAEKDLEITDFSKPVFWRFRTAAADRHTYRVSISLFKADGTEVRIPEKEETSEVLVLVPPRT